MQNFIQLIYNNTGLYIHEEDTETLYNKIYARMKLLNFSSLEKYYQLLNTSNYQSNSSDSSECEFTADLECRMLHRWRAIFPSILVKQLIPDYDSWNILISGTDINPEAIKKAKRGIFTAASKR